MLDEIAELKSAVNDLCVDFTISQITFFENLDPAAIVGADYVAFRFNCSESAVVRGRFETNRIPRVRRKPLAFVKRDVDAVWRNLNRSATDKAAELRYLAGRPTLRTKRRD